MKNDKTNLIDKWNRNANTWDASFGSIADPIRTHVITADLILKLIGDVKGKTIIDAGCGNGYLCNFLSLEYAQKVIGIDLSKGMLYNAKQRTKRNSNVELIQADLTNIPLNAESADAIVSITVLSNIPDYQQVFREWGRILKYGKPLVFATLHPCFTGNNFKVIKKKNYPVIWQIENYFNSSPYSVTFPNYPSPLINHPRTLSQYFSALHNAGFMTEQIQEPLPDENAIRKYPDWFAEKGRKIPRFLVVKSVKS